jgi:chromosome condensin MukBEF ATPase and DNA-binding subunit MukB
MLRENKKMRKELRASLEDARTRVAELETQLLDCKLEIDSLKACPVVLMRLIVLIALFSLLILP